MSLRVLVLHNSYREPGGEDVVAAAEVALLRGAGHEVHFHEFSNRDLRGPVAGALALLRASHDPDRARWVCEELQRTRADVLHVHNFFPLLTPAVHEAAARRGVAVVQTLHNYRTLCAGTFLRRGGAPCEKCVPHARHWGVVHRCCRGSMAASLALMRTQNRFFDEGIRRRGVHRLVALTEFGRDIFLRGGMPADRLAVKPNFAPRAARTDHPRHGALYVGRLASEKGVEILAEAWRHLPDIPLRILGTGPLETVLRSAAPTHVGFEGQASPSQVRDAMASARFLVIPSLWHEGLPMVLAEAFAAGLPVLASDIGALSELVTPGVDGALFPAGDAGALSTLAAELDAEPDRLEALGSGARATYEARYTPERNLALLLDIYRQAIEEAAAARRYV